MELNGMEMGLNGLLLVVFLQEVVSEIMHRKLEKDGVKAKVPKEVLRISKAVVKEIVLESIRRSHSEAIAQQSAGGMTIEEGLNIPLDESNASSSSSSSSSSSLSVSDRNVNGMNVEIDAAHVEAVVDGLIVDFLN
eukprot:TRINITY_DN1607_c2_g1_i2.p1 TRINITY_DN1607_c2_g1~~TRINITY_DN1607_c2_g1_i2.p1  ORF type:complete len:136 (+),score=52.37 TRINITY_DN1607_c2_g1_i2:29-436(+)